MRYFNNELKKLDFKHKIILAGNHDMMRITGFRPPLGGDARRFKKVKVVIFVNIL